MTIYIFKGRWSIDIQVPCKSDLFWCSSYIYSGFLSYENILDFNFCSSDSVLFTNKMIEKGDENSVLIHMATVCSQWKRIWYIS